MARATILLVEDRDLAALLQCVLRSAGYRVLICRTGRHALQICGRLGLKIELVLTTFLLPDTDGAELAVQLKNAHPHLKIIGMSIYQASATRFAGCGIAFLQKPFSYAELIARIREVIG
ncbi:MAG TPA: response regulator [Terriglobia bacterium]|jgi:DNA-binding response OmpR family regulator